MNIPTKPGSSSIEIHGNFVDGREIEAGHGAMLDVRNPATGEVIAQIPNSTAEDIDRAMKSARAAFEGKAWGGMDIRARARLVNKLADAFEANLDQPGLREALADPTHLSRHRQIPDPHLSQVIVHVLAEPIEHALAEVAHFGALGDKPPQQKREMQHDHPEPAVNRIRNAIAQVEDRGSRLRHDGAIDRRDGADSPASADEGENHLVARVSAYAVLVDWPHQDCKCRYCNTRFCSCAPGAERVTG